MNLKDIKKLTSPEQISNWKARINARAKYVQRYQDAQQAEGGRAASLHEILTRPMTKRIVVGVSAIVLVIVMSLLPTGTTKAAATDLSMQREADETVLEDAFIMDTFELSAKCNAFGTVKLSWEEIPDAPGYVVYRYNEEEETFDPIATIEDSTKTTYFDKDVKAGNKYSYQVTPLFALQEKMNSNVVDIKVRTERPKLSLDVDGQDVQLTWTKIKGADQYTVLRATKKKGEYAEVAYVDEPEFYDEDLTSGRTYYYKVFAEKDGKVTRASKVKSTGEIEEAESSSGSGGSYDGGGLYWPVPEGGYVSSGFGGRYSPTWGASSSHQGIDIACSYGTPITAAAGGTVVEVSYSGARGNYIVVSHGDTLSTLYQHLSSTACYVGQSVSAGDTIGYAGSTGISTGTHLHFEVHVYGTPVDPMGYL